MSSEELIESLLKLILAHLKLEVFSTPREEQLELALEQYLEPPQE